MWFAIYSRFFGLQFILLLLFFVSDSLHSCVQENLNESASSDDCIPESRYLYAYGGQSTFPNEFPFMAALGWRDESGGLHFLCGGMLISSNMVLTAAHCAYLKGKIPDAVYIGGASLAQEDNEEYSVVNAIIYPEYNSSQAYYDIALLELRNSSLIRPICLWTKPNLYVNNVTAIGYGLTTFAGFRTKELLKVNLTVFDERYCQPFFKRKRKFKSGLSHAHICAGDIKRQMDTCQGDSGGPLLAVHKHKTYAVGITSAGQACSGLPPAIYTKISSYIGWIKNVLTERGFAFRRECD